MKTLLSLFVTTLILTSCASAPDPAVRYVDPASQGQITSTGIESQDIAAAAQKAAQSILVVPAIAHASQPPVVLITPVTNRSAATVDTSLYTTKVRGTLMQYALGKVLFLARDASESVNDKEQAMRQSGKVKDRNTAKSGRVGESYDYVLTAELQGISASNSKGQSDYYLIAFKLVDFNDILVWESQYEIKKEGKESAVYR